MTVVIEGEIVASTFRRRDRNAGRVVDVLPPSKDEKLAVMSRWTPERQVEHVTDLLVQANTSLLFSIAAQDLSGIATAKAKAGTIQELVKQLRLGRDMQKHAAKFVRCAERGLGVGIREGQARGDVRRAGQKIRLVNQHGASDAHPDRLIITRPTDYATATELSGVGSDGIYAMTDGVSDEHFVEALAEAEAEDNLSRANVARKCKAKAHPIKEAIDADAPLIDADVDHAPPQKKRLTKHDGTEMLANINGMLNGIVASLPFIDAADVDRTSNRLVIANIRRSMGSIRTLLKEIEND